MLPVIYGNVNVFFHNNFTSFLCIIYNFSVFSPSLSCFFNLSETFFPSSHILLLFLSGRSASFPFFPFFFFQKIYSKMCSHLFVSYIRFRSLHTASLLPEWPWNGCSYQTYFPEPLKPFPTAVPCNTGKNTSFILRMIKGNKKRKGEHSSSFLS